MAGYSGTPLVKKLGVKEGFNIHIINAPVDYRRLLAQSPARVQFASAPNAATNMVHVFATERAQLARTLSGLRKKLAPDATIWVSWPKQSSKRTSRRTPFERLLCRWVLSISRYAQLPIFGRA
jgi:hypothetical protein